MRVKKTILAPAKLNIFLKILGKRKDGYHEIRSGITLINLFDQIKIEQNDKNIINYTGIFKPSTGSYVDCVIKKTLNFLEIKNKINFRIDIIKNIPVQGGLGSASTNAAALINALEELNFIGPKNPEYYTALGADIPFFLSKKDCLIGGIGDKIIHRSYPKYFFLLVKPKFINSTKYMYKQLNFNPQFFNEDLILRNSVISDADVGNDFEEIVKKNNPEYNKIIDYLENFDQVKFVRMTGSGSCCYAAFEKKNHALNALQLFKNRFPDLWTFVCENNIIKT